MELTKDQKEALVIFNNRINQEPDVSKIRTEKDESTGDEYKYIPVSIIETDLREIYFGLVQKEFISYTNTGKKEIVVARIKVFHPVLCEWLVYDGVGVAVIGIHETEIVKIVREEKLNPSLAYAEALKSGAKKIGAYFGSNLNRSLEDIPAKSGSKGKALN